MLGHLPKRHRLTGLYKDLEGTEFRYRQIHGFARCFEPCPGDCVFLPAGTVHAVGGGVLMAEVQQTSDAAFRLAGGPLEESSDGLEIAPDRVPV